MKKIGIVTINGNYNFGNRLQNYALQETLKKKGFNVETVWYLSKKENIKLIIKSVLSKFNMYKRYSNFSKFSKKYINVKYVKNYNISKEYDYFVTGSDQVWNYTFPHFDENMFLSFSKKEQNISYAASFGVSSIDENKKQDIITGINNINYISVREDAGKEIIESLTNITDACVLVDPTMLLSKEDWDKISVKPDILKDEKYILNYFLGDLSKNRKNEIERIAKINNCKIINILKEDDPFYSYGPSEFLYLEKHAFLICTDSFHSCVFALIYNRPFLIFDREQNEIVNMNSRLDTLIKKFKLKNRRFEGEITKENLEHDYTEAHEILEKEKIKSDLFLTKALNIKTHG